MGSLVDSDRLLRFFAIPGIVRRSNWLLRTGRRSDAYIDFDLLVADPFRAETVAQNFIAKITEFRETHGIDVLAFLEKASGGTVGAIMLATQLSTALNLPIMLVRPGKDIPAERVKIHRYESESSPLDLEGRRVLIITDHVTTGEEIVQAASEVRSNGGEVAGAIAFTANTELLRTELLEEQGVLLVWIKRAREAQEAASRA